ncbi:MAG: stage III sporulation protein AF, partial [Clostridiaceae bacterium]|nr:stage III sporulation protein AF [Clostridiaceae bacterium]
EAKADIIINEDYNSTGFGEVKKVYLAISMEKEKKVKPVIKVERVNVGKSNEKKINEPLVELEIDKNIRKEIEEKVERMLGTKRENIVISLANE